LINTGLSPVITSTEYSKSIALCAMTACNGRERGREPKIKGAAVIMIPLLENGSRTARRRESGRHRAV